MTVTLNLSLPEISVIRSWYEYSTDDSLHSGGSRLQLPSEQVVLDKLTCAENEQFTFSDSELAVITDWMDRSINRKYGSAKYLFGFEQQLYFKIKSTADSLEMWLRPAGFR